MPIHKSQIIITHNEILLIKIVPNCFFTTFKLIWNNLKQLLDNNHQFI